jgi:hypothetical protein
MGALLRGPSSENAGHAGQMRASNRGATAHSHLRFSKSTPAKQRSSGWEPPARDTRALGDAAVSRRRVWVHESRGSPASVEADGACRSRRRPGIRGLRGRCIPAASLRRPSARRSSRFVPGIRTRRHCGPPYFPLAHRTRVALSITNFANAWTPSSTPAFMRMAVDAEASGQGRGASSRRTRAGWRRPYLRFRRRATPAASSEWVTRAAPVSCAVSSVVSSRQTVTVFREDCDCLPRHSQRPR